jgi:peptidoglycan L-alanyl-D-glutamate endopeptidase CwlK
MYNYSSSSKANLDTCHQRLQDLFTEVLKTYDHSVLSGYRTQVEQDKLVADGKSQLKYPRSKHNTNPSMAVDVQPYPMTHVYDLIRFIGYVERTALDMGIKIRLGLDWEMDRDTSNNWVDAYHVEYMGEL